MIIKSHIRGGYRDAAAYLKAQGQNEKIRTVEISDLEARNLDEAFQNMWAVASKSKAKKPLHHISINPYKDERLTDEQVLRIVERCEQKYGYKPGDHQRVIVEHIKDGRQHFHVMWNRVSVSRAKTVWPGHHWKKSKQVAREMEKELGLKCPPSKRAKRARAGLKLKDRARKTSGRYDNLQPGQTISGNSSNRPVGLTCNVRDEFKETARNSLLPLMPTNPNTSGMCQEQLIDYKAACERKITWAEYFRKWGREGLSLN